MSGIEIGHLVGGRHRVQEYVGEGALGYLFRAHDEEHDSPVAVEIARASALVSDDLTERLTRAVQEASAVQHPVLVRLVDVGEDAGRPYVARAWIDGTDLGHRYVEGPPACADAVAILEQLAQALDAIHAAGQVHGDIGATTVIVRDTPTGPRAYLTGLGVRRALLAAGVGPTLTLGVETAGLPGALAPELAAGAPPDARGDIYALACVAFELLSGTPPFTGPTAAAVLAAHASRPRPQLSARRPALPPALDVVLKRAMALDPKTRPSSAGAFVAALHAGLGNQPHPTASDATLVPGRATARTTGRPSPRPVIPGGRRWRRVLVGVALVIAAAGGAVAGASVAASDDAPSNAIDVPVLKRAPRWQPGGVHLRLRAASAPGPEAQAAVIETLKEFVRGHALPLQGSDELWVSSFAEGIVVEAPDAAGRCVRTLEPTPPNPKLPVGPTDPVSFGRTGVDWLLQRRVTAELPWTLQGLHAIPSIHPWRGLRPADVSFRGSRLASWRGISVAFTGRRSHLRLWLARDGLGARWKVLYVDFCPDTFAGP